MSYNPQNPNGQATKANSSPVVIASDQDALAVTVASAATNIAKTEDVGHNTGDTGVYALGTRQDTPAATAGTTGDYQGAAYTAQGAQWSTLTPSTTGGWDKWSTPNNNSNAALVATAGGVTVKGSAGTFGGYYCFNPNSTVTYLQVFDTSSAVTLGTTRPHLVFGIPANSAANIEFVNGINMANAIKIAATTTASNSTAPGTGMDVTILYK
jgi:hypothetical protein